MFFNLKYVQSFSYLQQYLIICSSISLISVWFGSVWCSIFLPVGSLFGFVLVKKGISLDKGLSISLFDFYNSFVEWREKQKREQSSAENDAVFAERFKAEREIFVEKICEKYFFWYKKFLSEDERFPAELKAIFRSIFERLEFRLKNIELSDATRRIFKLKTFHVEHCLKSFDLFNRQRKFQRTSENVEEEFSANFSFHWSISKNDPNSHIKAIVDLILTDLLPERFLLFSTPPARELITEILTNALFLPLVYRFSQPENVFFLIATIFENEQQRKIEESLDEDFPFSRTDFQQTSTQISDDPLDKNDEQFVSNNGNQQRIIFQVKITGNSNVSDEFSGANFTVYLIECTTKSTTTADGTIKYTIRRRFREFINLHKRLKKNQKHTEVMEELNGKFSNLPMFGDYKDRRIVEQRQRFLNEYIQILVENEELNRSHDFLEFVGFNCDPNREFDGLLNQRIKIPRIDQAFLGAISDLRDIFRIPSKPADSSALPERAPWKIPIGFEKESSVGEQIEAFTIRWHFHCQTSKVQLSDKDSAFLELLTKRTSLVENFPKKKRTKDFPLTEVFLEFFSANLNSPSSLVSQPAARRLFKNLCGNFTENLIKRQIEQIFTREKILLYAARLRETVWPQTENSQRSKKNIRRRAFQALLNQIPESLQIVVGKENLQRALENFFQCLTRQQFNRHFLCELIDLLVEILIPDVKSVEFLRKYVERRAGSKPSPVDR